VSDVEVPHQELLMQVAEKLSNLPSITDYLMLTKWRVLSMCQHLLGTPEREIERACQAALQAFVAHGPGIASDGALKAAGGAIRRLEGLTETILPSISKEKRLAVSTQLGLLASGGATTIERALRVLPTVRGRMSATIHLVSLPGIRHRFEQIAAVLEDTNRPEGARVRAATGVLYVDEINDVIADTFGIIGMVDDDYALRVLLEEILGGDQGSLILHWSEKICSLWDDLPFLQGMNLQRGDRPISVTWLDRVNSYVSYTYVLGPENATLVLLQPSIACSPLHTIVSLIGLLVLDALTSAQSKAQVLRPGQTYEIDGRFRARFVGVAESPISGWLRLRMREGFVYQPPELADRMVPVSDHRLSSLREFSSRPRTASADPIQRFFDWDTTIGSASISSHLVLVASRQRALDLLEGVQSNGVHLLDHGLVRFVGADPAEVETYGSLILIVPSLSAARVLLERGVRIQTILVDGYQRLQRGRHELPFLINRRRAPPIISWSAAGYYPAAPPAWMPPHRRLEVSSSDLASMLELDDASKDLAHSALWEAAIGAALQARVMPATATEVAIVDAIDAHLGAVRSSQHLPEYWQYHLTTLGRTLRILVTSTPAQWADIRSLACQWSSSIAERWSSLRSSTIAALAGLRKTENVVSELIANSPDGLNSRAAGLVALIGETKTPTDHWHLICDRQEQAKVVASLLRAQGLRCVEPTILRDLRVYRNCIVAGWVSSSFARRLWAHTPRTIVALVDENDRQRWNRAADAWRHPGGQSLLGAVEGLHTAPILPDLSVSPDEGDELADEGFAPEWDEDDRVPCVFLWLTSKSEAKILARDGRVVVEEGDVVRERVAARLRPDNRVILGSGTSRWSPADEFTDAVVEAVRISHPELVRAATEWRKALRRFQNAQRLSIAQLRARLATAGIAREAQTIEGWLEVSRASPIAPRGMRAELTALWLLIEEVTELSLEDVAAACARLRALRAASGRALLQLWKGQTVQLGIDEAWLDDLVKRLRQEVEVYEVEAVTLGEVPPAMLGWWLPPGLVSCFESSSAQIPAVPAAEGEDEAGVS
jgi:hypothetical protein